MYRPSQHDFSKIPQAIIQRSSFNRSHPIKTTFDVDNIVPIFFDEALPGDTFNCKLHAFCRLATWTVSVCKTKKMKGLHDIYFVFKGGEGELFNFDWWSFKK